MLCQSLSVGVVHQEYDPALHKTPELDLQQSPLCPATYAADGERERPPWPGMEQSYPSDRIGLLLDMDEGSLSVYRNDLRLGTMLQSYLIRTNVHSITVLKEGNRDDPDADDDDEYIGERRTALLWAIEAGCEQLAVMKVATKPPPAVVTPETVGASLRCPNGHALVYCLDHPEDVR